MADWTGSSQTNQVERLTSVPAELRLAIKNETTDQALHDHYFDTLPVLREVEAGGAAQVASENLASIRVIAWNVERLRHMDAIAETLKAEKAGVMMLSEIDRGMARTGNTDRIAELAETLQCAYSYAVEFIELDLGDPDEKRDHAGQENRDGYHGAGTLTSLPVEKHFLIRIDRRGDWFDGSRDQPRVGGRIGLGTVIRLAGRAVVFVNVHMESHGDPQQRADDMHHLLTLIDMVEPGAAVVIGGDFNTSTASYDERSSNWAAWDAKIKEDPARLLCPQTFEPMFQVAAGFGYETKACNVDGAATTRHPAGSSRSPAKIDWFFTRGVTASDPAIIPAVRSNGSPSSDHEAIAVTISVPEI